jgi:hypothetical protein
MKTLTTSTNPTAEDDRRLGRLRLQGLRLPLGLRPLLVGRRLGHNSSQIKVVILPLISEFTCNCDAFRSQMVTLSGNQ